MFKKKNFLAKTSANNITKLLATVLSIHSDKEGCTNGRSITLISLISDILFYQRDKEKLTLTEKDFEKILELEYLHNLANNHKIKDKDLHLRLKEYLLSFPKNYNQETQTFESSETSKEQHDYITKEIKKNLPLIGLLNSYF